MSKDACKLIARAVGFAVCVAGAIACTALHLHGDGGGWLEVGAVLFGIALI